MIPPEYLNGDGFVTIQPNAPVKPGEGNGWLQTGVAVAAGLYAPAASDMSLLILRCALPPPEPMFIWRSPWKKNPGDETKCDDYWGALLCSTTWAAELYLGVTAHGWSFDLLAKNRLEYRFDRFIHFPPFVRACAGEELSFLDHAILGISILIDALTLRAADANMRTFCVAAAARKASWFGARAGDFWCWRARKKYGNIGRAWVGYFPAGHPVTAYDGENWSA